MFDELDKEILTKIQSEFPIASSPYQVLAGQLNSTEDEVFERVVKLKEAGYIRRLGGVFDTKKLGFHTTLVAAKVDTTRLDEIAHYINEYSGVTHNYKRNHDFNLWFTMAAPTKEKLTENLQEIADLTGVERVLDLPAVKMYKLGVKLPIN